jgi:hypothetical protein
VIRDGSLNDNCFRSSTCDHARLILRPDTLKNDCRHIWSDGDLG